MMLIQLRILLKVMQINNTGFYKSWLRWEELKKYFQLVLTKDVWLELMFLKTKNKPKKQNIQMISQIQVHNIRVCLTEYSIAGFL